MKLKRFIVNILFYINLGVAFLLVLTYLSVYINPSKFWLPAFFGLAYPYLLLVNFVFAIFWLIRKKTKALVSILAIVIGWNHLASNIGITLKHANNDEKNEISVLSYNIQMEELVGYNNSNKTRNTIIEFVKNYNPSILCFQDYFVRYGKPMIVPIEMINQYKNENCVIQSGNYATNYGLAIFSQYPLIFKGEIHFEKSSNFCVFGDYLINGDTVRIYNAHLQSIRFMPNDYEMIEGLSQIKNENRLKQAQSIAVKLKKAFQKRGDQVLKLRNHILESPYKTIVCGDFNDTPVSFTYHQISEILEDAFRQKGNGFGNTYAGKAPSFRIDYIFHDKSFKTTGYKKFRIFSSDHFPVMAEISME